MGDRRKRALRVQFDGKLRLEFHGARITSDAGLLPFREMDEAFRLTETAALWGAFDPTADILYVYSEHYQKRVFELRRLGAVRRSPVESRRLFRGDSSWARRVRDLATKGRRRLCTLSPIQTLPSLSQALPAFFRDPGSAGFRRRRHASADQF